MGQFQTVANEMFIFNSNLIDMQINLIQNW